MPELRWNPVLKEWVIVAAYRQKRPQLPENFCPFCPGAPEIPSADWTVKFLPNKYASLRMDPPEPDLKNHPLYQVRPNKGQCEIILYAPEHNTTLGALPVEHIHTLVDFWAERYEKIGSQNFIKYVLIFENRGREIGVSLDHPHGQIYSFGFIPPKPQLELDNSYEYFNRNKKCLFCDILDKELNDKKRIVIENPNFVCFVPFFATWPYGVHIYPKRHVQSLLELTEKEKRDLAEILKAILLKYDKLFDMLLPYEMIFHQEPTDGKKYPHYHFHIEFYIIHRAKNKIKFLGGCEQGAGVFVNPIPPEKTAEELRQIKI
ncbi:MAG: galactose-1-phosphate uridylyltransferase [Candidatus Helarchaeota archaeon]